MPNGGDSQEKKLLNNGRLRADLKRVKRLCKLAEDHAKTIGGPAVVRLCGADKGLRDAIAAWKEKYDLELDAVEDRLAKSLTAE